MLPQEAPNGGQDLLPPLQTLAMHIRVGLPHFMALTSYTIIIYATQHLFPLHFCHPHILLAVYLRTWPTILFLYLSAMPVH